MNFLRLLLYCACASSASCFLSSPKIRQHPSHSQLSTSLLHLVTESDVIQAVEKAEQLWEQALSARKHANELSAKAETMGLEAETSTGDATKLLTGKSISVEKVEEARRAQQVSLELGYLLDEARVAEEKADEIESKAEEALKESEASLAQYVIDFPEEA